MKQETPTHTSSFVTLFVFLWEEDDSVENVREVRMTCMFAEALYTTWLAAYASHAALHNTLQCGPTSVSSSTEASALSPLGPTSVFSSDAAFDSSILSSSTSDDPDSNSSDESCVCPYFKQQAFFIELMEDEGADFRRDIDTSMSRILIYPAAKLRMPPPPPQSLGVCPYDLDTVDWLGCCTHSPLTEGIKSPIDTAIRLQRQREYFRKRVEGPGEEARERYGTTQAGLWITITLVMATLLDLPEEILILTLGLLLILP